MKGINLKYIGMIFLIFILNTKKIKDKIQNKLLEIPYKLLEYIPYKVTNNIHADIIICPGGRYGAYHLGICHYIKNNFDISNKKILGFSVGSWNSLFMVINKKYDHEILRKIFKIKSKKMTELLKKTKQAVEDYDINEYNMKYIYIGTTTTNGLVIHNNFLTLDDVTRCCIASSFIPYLTYNDMFYFYKNKSSFDGGMYCKKYINSKNITTSTSPLVITYKMFGRYAHINILKDVANKTKPDSYQLYIKGYRDSINNHVYFEKYFA
jgi:hypothetical protein